MVQLKSILSLVICFNFLFSKAQSIEKNELKFIQKNWVVSNLESNESKLVYRDKNHFFVNSNLQINRPRRRCGNEYFSKKKEALPKVIYNIEWELINIGELQIVRIKNQRVDEFKETVLLKEAFFELEELTKHKMVLIRL
ncbi:hypothetical protein LV716_07205 [Flagellimonas sp. HMM57]|uniref:hypothetical protein n=1 Tax=unclassified Flagellimonas TaxID=2644544 RepID=UPI0013D8778E|nr:MULTISPECIES: hypothetical protein [unclassified Flagellimonas]UII77549.1 hypothetical protein LV716_07205 [Flagellimonas sp. HMM57]